MYFKPTKYHC